MNLSQKNKRPLIFWVVTFLTLPFSFVPNALDPGLHVRFLIWAAASLLLLVLVSHDKLILRPSKIVIVGALFLMITGICMESSLNFPESIFVWLKFFTAGIFFLLTCRIMDHGKGFLEMVGKAALIPTGGFCLILVSQTCEFACPELIINKNLYAAELFLTLPFVGIHFFSGKKIWQIVSGVFWIFALSVVWMCRIRGVQAAALLSLIPVGWLILCYPFNRFPCKKVRRGLGLGLVLFFFLGTLTVWTVCTDTRPGKRADTVILRLKLWQASARMIKDNPLSGCGLGQWRLLLSDYGGPVVHEGNKTLFAQRPHNDLLWVACEAGIPCALVYLACFAVLLHYGAGIMKKGSDRQKYTALLMVYGTSGYFIIAMVSYPLERCLPSLFLSVMAAVLTSSYGHVYPPMKPMADSFISDLVFKGAKGTAGIVLCFCILVAGGRLYSEIQVKKGLQFMKKRQWQKAIGMLDKAIPAAYGIDAFGNPVDWYQAMAYYQLKETNNAIRYFYRALSCHPHHLLSRRNLVAVVREVAKSEEDRSDTTMENYIIY